MKVRNLKEVNSSNNYLEALGLDKKNKWNTDELHNFIRDHKDLTDEEFSDMLNDETFVSIIVSFYKISFKSMFLPPIMKIMEETEKCFQEKTGENFMNGTLSGTIVCIQDEPDIVLNIIKFIREVFSH